MSESAQPARRGPVDEKFKRNAVDLSMRGDRTIRQLAQELGVSPDMLYRWRTEFGVTSKRLGRPEAALPRSVPELELEVKALRSRLAEMEERELILKKSLGILSPPTRGMPKSKP